MGTHIKKVTGDILLTRCEAIAHGIAPNDDFKQGLALSLRERWPAMYKDFRHYCQTYNPKEGDLWTWQGPSGFAIINLFTQHPPKHQGDRPGKASLPNINHCMKTLLKEVSEKKFKSIAVTRLATGVGGLPWTEVEPMLIKGLSELKIPAVIYETFQAGVAGEK